MNGIRLWFVLSILFIPFFSYGQWANDWVNYNQKYIEFKVYNEGIYRINQTGINAALATVGETASNIDPRKFQIFGKGVELPIYISGESDGTFDANDFIEFYAQGNDGWLDSALYVSTEDQANPYYSLFNDTATYYLTWSTSTSNLRATALNNTNFSGTPTKYFYHQKRVQPTSLAYMLGRYESLKYDALYTSGEGWFGDNMTGTDNNPLTKSFSIVNKYNGIGAPNTKVVAVLAAGSTPNRRLIVQSNGVQKYDTTWGGRTMVKLPWEITPAQLGLSLDVKLELVGSNGADLTALSYISVEYPHNYDLEAKSTFLLEIPYAGASQTYISATNFISSGGVVLHDLNDGYRVTAVPTGNNFQALVPEDSGGERKKCFVSSVSKISTINDFKASGNGGVFYNLRNIDPDSAFIIISHSSLMNEAEEYKNYRTTTGHNVVLIDIQEVYDQFSYGIDKHPLSVRNFADFTLQNWSTPPQNLFLIGKSITNANQSSRNNTNHYSRNLIPSYGWPACDNVFTAGLNGTTIESAIPTGRLAATNPSDVSAYLNKVMEFESVQNGTYFIPNIEDRIWTKRAVHFGGGEADWQRNKFKGFLQSYQDTIEGKFMGAKVTEFYKATIDVIDFSLADSIRNLINNGVALLSFFGHSSANSFDINIDQAANYNNKGKYFFLLSNGCYSGDIHTNTSTSISEDFVLIADKGAIGFIASTNVGLDDKLHQYTRELYSNFGHQYYGKSIGICMQQASKKNYQLYGNGFTTRETAYEMTLHGDPALALVRYNKPDYALIKPVSVAFSPAEVTAELDSFDIKILVSNLGKAPANDLSVSIRRVLNDGSDTTYIIDSDPVYFQDTLVLTLPNNQNKYYGLNTFEIRLDPSNLISEISEFNNDILNNTVELYITSGDLIPIEPYQFAVVPSFTDLTLKASTDNPFASNTEYIFQLDTTDAYNSLAKQEFITSQSGGVVEWKPIFSPTTDSIVYFWRCGPNHINADSIRWRESSFQYINDKKGWGQDHFYQIKDNDFTKINYLKQNQTLTFDTNSASFSCTVFGMPQGNEYFGIMYTINGEVQAQSDCNGSPVFFVAVIDPVSLEPWQTAAIINSDTFNIENDFGNGNNLLDVYPNNCLTGQVEKHFSFHTTFPEQMDSLVTFLENKIPDGHYVLAYSAGVVNYQSNALIASSGAFGAFQSLGSTLLSGAPNAHPWIFFVKKGDLSTKKEVLGTIADTTISMLTTLYSNANFGRINSPFIGPAKSWENLTWNFSPDVSSESLQLKVLNQQGGTLAVFNNNSGSVGLNSYVSDGQDYIQLSAELLDDSVFTPMNFSSWHILYEPAPEAALNYHMHYLFENDTLAEGQELSFSIAIDNVSAYDMDSLHVSYKIIGSNGSSHTINYQTQDSLRAGQRLIDTIHYSSFNLGGFNTLFVEVNPKDNFWQKEMYHFNNIARLNFYVHRDNTNPLLDVTFDGVHILDGDIVSPFPEINIRLQDENQYLLMNEVADTANFDIWLVHPDDKIEAIPFIDAQGNELLTYTLATPENNRFEIEYKPELKTDGVYKLRVKAKDKAGNLSGDIDYIISFEVVNKSTITNVLNYPNPFSTSTRFVFTLTGSKIPDQFNIQILSITGKIVRQIDANEFGPIRIGRNISTFAWDGTDDYGDPLANGVYMYRVNTKIHGENIEHRWTEASQYFKKDFGKLYLMR